MKLDILVTHYKEPWEIVKPLLDSIGLQRGVDFDNIRVIIGNDGDEVLLPTVAEPTTINDYPFEVEYYTFEHGGISATRNKLMDKASADYIMFCDCDDCFLNVLALNFVFSAMNGVNDYINCAFVEERTAPNEYGQEEKYYIPHQDDIVFVHGKAIRLGFLRRFSIRFFEDVTAHEDVAFNVIAQNLAEKMAKITNPVYMWCENGASVSRQKDFMKRTYPMLIHSRDRMIEELEKFKVKDTPTIFAVAPYYELYNFSAEDWSDEDRTAAYKALHDFYEKYKHYKAEISSALLTQIITNAKNKAALDGCKKPEESFHDWFEKNIS